MKTIAIVGVGLIGGSFALALRKAGFQGKIIGVSSPATVQKALALGVIDEALPLAEAAAAADLVYLSQPISQILATLDVLETDALVTDAGSTKAVICERARKLKRFVGGHPMAGKESRGVEHADADLFRGRPYVLTAREPQLETWIERFGARLVILDPVEHDRQVAFVSHLPQLLSTTLAAVLAGKEQVAGPAAADLTRLALSPYDIWRDIFATNAEPIDAALGAFIARLEEVRSNCALPSMEALSPGCRVRPRPPRQMNTSGMDSLPERRHSPAHRPNPR